jgi:drug/metabolite transporter (DMT)-like permease
MHPSQVSRESALALLYLIVFGSLLTLSCYLWLLRVARTSLVSTYAYVNPVVAVFLGWLVLHEPITAQILVAAAVILASVALIVSAAGAARDRSSGEDRRTKVEAEIGFES